MNESRPAVSVIPTDPEASDDATGRHVVEPQDAPSGPPGGNTPRNGQGAGEAQRNPFPSDDELALDEEQVREETEIHERRQGDVVDPDSQPEYVWSDPMEAFLSDAALAVPEEDFPLVRESTGIHVKLRVRAIPTARYNKLINDCTVRRRDKQTGEFITIVREDEVRIHVLLNGIVNIDFHSKALLKKHNVETAEQLINKMLYKGEILQISNKIAALSGYEQMGMEDEAGNY